MGASTIRNHFPKKDKKPVMWGNQFPTTLHPRQALKEFIPRCLDRGLLLGLSTWFFGPGDDPKRVNQCVENVQGLDGFVRVWDETLRFLKDNDLLHNIYYVDLLNEYPLFSGFKWLRDHMDSDMKVRREKAKAEGVHEWKEQAGSYNNEASRKFYTGFANDAITRLQVKWPDLDFLFSLTYNRSADWRAMATTKIAALDAHYWFVMNPLLSAKTGYWENIHRLADSDAGFPKVQEALVKNWTAHKPKLIEWMDQQMAEVAALGRQHNKPFGNTEGWGTINWLDHPALSWDIIKEAGEICASLGRKHGYRFNCTSQLHPPAVPAPLGRYGMAQTCHGEDSGMIWRRLSLENYYRKSKDTSHERDDSFLCVTTSIPDKYRSARRGFRAGWCGACHRSTRPAATRSRWP